MFESIGYSSTEMKFSSAPSSISAFSTALKIVCGISASGATPTVKDLLMST